MRNPRPSASPEITTSPNRRISFVIVARDEPAPLLNATIQGVLQTSASYGPEITIVDDGSLVPVSSSWPGVHLIRNSAPMGTSQARRYGALRSHGDILVFIDAHMRFAPDWLERMLTYVESGALLCAAWWDYELTRPLCWGANFIWCGERNYAAGRSPGFTYQHRTEYPGDGASEVPMLIGACYMMLRTSYDRIGGFSPFFRTWGKLEQDLSLHAWIVGLQVKCVAGAHVGHFTRAKHPYPVSWSDVEFNQVASVRTTFKKPVAQAIERLLQPLPNEVQTWLALVDFRAWRQLIQSHRRMDDAEFLRRFVSNAPECVVRAASA